MNNLVEHFLTLQRELGGKTWQVIPVLVCVWVLSAGIAWAESPTAVTSPDVGFLFDEFRLTLAEGSRVEAAGPLYFHEQKDDERSWGIPPLFSRMRNDPLETVEYDFLYPLFTYDRYGEQYRAQFLHLLSFAGGATQVETNRNRFTIFPFYFQQRSTLPEENYTALFPVYGNLQNRLGRDRIHFVLFPGYSQTRRKDVVTDNYLFPFFHLRHGDNLSGWQVWPLLGAEHKGITYRTNHWGDAQMIGGHERYMALWPLFHKQRNGLGTTNEQWQLAVLPLYAGLRSDARDSTTVLWPFFSKIEDRAKQYREWQAPWPFVVFADGPGKTTRRIWPLFGVSHNAVMRTETYLWPIYRRTSLKSAPLDRQRTRVLLFLYSDLTERNMETGTARRKTDLWPLFTHRHDHNGNTRLQVLAILEPLMPGSHKIERDWSPLYALWRAEQNARTGATSQSLLWNLYRREKTAGGSRWSALFGLLQHSNQPGDARWRLLHMPLGPRAVLDPLVVNEMSPP